MNPRYPVYIISKGRWLTRLTSKTLETMGVPYYIVVEPQEYDQYARYIAPGKILVLPFCNLGQGSVPARNWVWEHSLAQGNERHWILDDNIRAFRRYNNNIKYLVNSGTIFRVAEDFTDRYTNVALSGFQYSFFVTYCRQRPAFILNTRIYSCILIKNDIPFRWRGKYNEDTDLSIRVLQAGYCTILFNAFMQDKQATMTMKGGNTDELYAGDGRYEMAKSLQEQHPHLATVTQKFGRYQHQVDFKLFRNNKLIRKADLIIPEGTNEYGMVLKQIREEQNEEEKS